MEIAARAVSCETNVGTYLDSGWYHDLRHYWRHHHLTKEHITVLLEGVHLLVEQRYHLLHHLNPPPQGLDLGILHLTLQTAIDVIVLHFCPLPSMSYGVLIHWRVTLTVHSSHTVAHSSHCSYWCGQAVAQGAGGLAGGHAG